MTPELVVHADWGSAPKKRWMACAVRQNGRYRALLPTLAGPPQTLLSRLRADAGVGGCLFLGFDFPIGVPSVYAGLAGVQSFLGLLPLLGTGTWADFFTLAELPDQISLSRPFYPYSTGGTCHQHLLDGLGVASIRELLRVCERGGQGRRDACALFWTLGGNQVGRAAIIGWRDVLQPALADTSASVTIWPFHGPLFALFGPGRTVIAETYPTEFYGHLGLASPPSRAGAKSGKQVQTDRRANAAALLHMAARLGVDIDPGLKALIDNGFEADKEGEDRFDAVVGLIGMLNVLLGGKASGEPNLPEVHSLEGWILGQVFTP